jgi:hypothetical protein
MVRAFRGSATNEAKMVGSKEMTKIVLGLLAGGGALCIVLAGVVAVTVRSIDLQILDVYFVVAPRYLCLLSAALFLAALVVWKTMVSH